MAVGDGSSPLHTYDTRKPQRKNAYGSQRSATSPPGFSLFPLFPFSFALPFLCVVVRSGGAGDESICEALIEGDAVVSEDSTGLPLLHGNLKRVELVLLRPLQSAN
ncbi:unnamed protein product [Sphagnum troendelagicum]|uniref:Uncharacterized protein n=1 Tax=Sphagnum troendelagicum TaxID=128251 RepID=A0ABP0UCG5_9BRYO